MLRPWIENITTIVNSRAISVSGLMAGMNVARTTPGPPPSTSANRVSIPARNGMPR